MRDYLLSIIKEILSFSPDGVSKVKLAKLVYFVHKGLTQKRLSESSSLAFIRMPLGPVPHGFNYVGEKDGVYIREESTGLSYNRQTYILKTPIQSPNEVVKLIVQSLINSPTSELVQYTHEEPSWINTPNGVKYCINQQDLNRRLPIKNWDNVVHKANDDQKIQALLINGMINEIVEDSTALEYPEEKIL